MNAWPSLKIIRLAGDKILAGGTTAPAASMAASRWNANGTPDLSFNGTGSATAQIGASCTGASLALQSDNKIVLGGSCTTNGQTKFAVARLREVEAKAPFDFDGDGKTDVGIFRPAAGEWWYSRSGDYAKAVELLLGAGARRPETIGGSAAVREVLQRG